MNQYSDRGHVPRSFCMANLNEALEQVASVRCANRLGVELDAVCRVRRMFECHDDAVRRASGHNEICLQDHERMIAHDLARIPIEQYARCRLDD